MVQRPGSLLVARVSTASLLFLALPGPQTLACHGPNFWYLFDIPNTLRGQDGALI